MASLAERLEEAWRKRFIGRTTEQEMVHTALTAAELPYALLYLFGPGGVGKTSFLRAAAAIAKDVGVSVLVLDARRFEPTPQAILAVLQQQVGCPQPDLIFPTLAAREDRFLLSIDTAELLTPLTNWLQDTFLPQLPPNVFVLMAGRYPPATRWRTDPGWQQFMRVRPLQNLTQEESRSLLRGRQVPEQEMEAVFRFTHGHPLALSLVADVFAQQPETHFEPEAAPDVIKTLLEQFLQEVPSPEHRTALEACSQIRLMTEPLLEAMLETADPYPIFEWLRSLSFVDAERRGLFLHDLAREALAADLQWRNPARQVLLHDRARNHYILAFHAADAQEQQQILADYIFLHRDNPLIRSYFEWHATGAVFTDSLRAEDADAVLEMIQHHEGNAAAKIAAHWLIRQPQGTIVLRGAQGEVMGVLLMVSLDKTEAADRAIDPGTAAAWNYLAQHAPLQPGQVATLFRFWMARDTYQAVSPVQSLIFLNMVQHYLTAPHLAFTMIPCAEPDFWTAIFGFADLQRLPQANFTVGERRFGVFGHDWRIVSPLTWLGILAERELGRSVVLSMPTITAPDVQPLSPDDEAFAAAVHDALRNFLDKTALANNPLLHSRLLYAAVGSDGDPSQRIAALQQAIREAANALQTAPRQMKLYRALHQTYFQPASTQEKAAELLDLPFSTYRRHLRAGIEYITEQLRQQERSS